MKDLFFSYDGRISRGKFWRATACHLLLLLSAVVLVVFKTEGKQAEALEGTQIVWILVGLLTCVIVFYSAICIGIKRFHDRDKPGIWVLVQLVPAIGSLWYFIETGFLAGTSGRNRYGEDPLVLNPLHGRPNGDYQNVR